VILLKCGKMLLSLVNVVCWPMVNWALKSEDKLRTFKHFACQDSRLKRFVLVILTKTWRNVAETFRLLNWTSCAKFDSFFVSIPGATACLFEKTFLNYCICWNIWYILMQFAGYVVRTLNQWNVQVWLNSILPLLIYRSFFSDGLFFSAPCRVYL